MVLETPSLLITDDDLDFRETLRGAFEPRGFRTLVAADGEEALAIVEREPVHLLLLDMHMPRLTGLETIRRITQSGRQLPCILISGGLNDAIVQQAQRANAFSILAKPVRFAEVVHVVFQALQVTYDWTDPGRTGSPCD